MPATKTAHYPKRVVNKALIGRALAHPARLRILELLEEFGIIRNADLIYALKLSKSTIHDHVKKLKEAELINIEYNYRGYLITRNNSVDPNQF